MYEQLKEDLDDLITSRFIASEDRKIEKTKEYADKLELKVQALRWAANVRRWARDEEKMFVEWMMREDHHPLAIAQQQQEQQAIQEAIDPPEDEGAISRLVQYFQNDR